MIDAGHFENATKLIQPLLYRRFVPERDGALGSGRAARFIGVVLNISGKRSIKLSARHVCYRLPRVQPS